MFFFIQFKTVSQHLVPYFENKKWGYKLGSEVKIIAEYDSVFAFNKENQLALVCMRNEFKNSMNPASKNKKKQFDYFYINSLNQKIKIKDDRFPDSVFVFEKQVGIENQYLDTNSVFKLVFQNKVYLVSKNGKQLSSGFDNISKTIFSQFYNVENNFEFDGKLHHSIGLIDTAGNKIIEAKYKQISFNVEDSSIYCCSAIFNSNQNDDVYDFSGKLIYSNKKHISYSSKNIHIMKLYEPKSGFLIENTNPKYSKIIKGTDIYYLGDNNALLVDNNNWYLLNFTSFERHKINKKSFNNSMFLIFGM